MRLVNEGAGSIRCNTFVKTTGVADAASVIDCRGAAIASSNVFAWRSAAPVASTNTCGIQYSLFDDDASVIPSGNQQQPLGEIVVDAAAGDYRPGGSSLARGMGEPGLGVAEDLVGTVRPLPAGTMVDIGAYEVE